MITAQVVLLNKEGLVLGVSRKTDHNDFGLPGGKMDPEDDGDPMVTAYRETLEETGLKITNLRLVFAIHKSGNMGYTYIADYEGEINHNEPHVVKWLPYETLIYGSFGKYNQLVSESLDDMGISYIRIAKPKNVYLYAIDSRNFINITALKHWKKHKTKGNVLFGEQLEDLDAICENNRIALHNVIGSDNEIFMVSRKGGETISSVEEIKELLEKSGFVTDKKFTAYINK